MLSDMAGNFKVLYCLGGDRKQLMRLLPVALNVIVEKNVPKKVLQLHDGNTVHAFTRLILFSGLFMKNFRMLNFLKNAVLNMLLHWCAFYGDKKESSDCLISLIEGNVYMLILTNKSRKINNGKYMAFMTDVSKILTFSKLCQSITVVTWNRYVYRIEKLKVKIYRDTNDGPGSSIAGGLESTCYKGDDSGLFVSKLAEGGPAQRAGLRVGRQAVTNVVNVRHQVRLLFFDFYDAICLIALIVAVTSMQNACDVVVITVLRDTLDNGLVAAPTTTFGCIIVSEEESFSKEAISATFWRDVNESPGFSVASGRSVNADTPIVISSIIPGGAVDKDGKLRVGDRILSFSLLFAE
uniref:PDZ domain-containing protein n=1 Tax=Syphacia muris TaxID=451379 RepID=A0A0N5ABM9_9BILA